MPDSRYTGYEQRPIRGGGNTESGTAPQGRSVQPRSAAGTTQRTGAQSSSAARKPSAQGGQVRPVSPNPMQKPPVRQSAQPRSASAGTAQSRPASAGGAARPRAAQGGSAPARQTRAGAAPARQNAGSARPAGSQQRRPGQYGAAPAARKPAARPATRSANAPKRTTSSGRGGGYGYAGASNGFGGMPPLTKGILAVLIVALLITICLAITSKIRESEPQPGISMNTSNPAAQTQATDQPTDEPTAEPTDVPAAPTDEPAQAASGRTATIRTIGDVIIDKTTLDNCETGDEEYDFSPLFELVGGVMSDADWTMINIEATLRRHSKYGYMGYPQFFTPHSILEDLKEVGVDMLTMCNNHALDGWYDGLKMSLDYADAAGLAHVGAYRTQEEHDTPEIYDIGGIKVGMVNYTQFTNSMESKCDPEATIYGMRLMRDADYEGDIADLKAAGAEFTIAIMHWGEEYIREPEDSIKAVARRLVAAGADLVIGGHPHVVQPAEYITAEQADGTSNTALVLYSIGNFYSEHRHANQPYTDNGVIFEFTLSENAQGEIEMAEPAFIPVYMWQTEGGGAYEFRAVPSGVYLNNPPAGMSGTEYERMVESYNEIVELIGGVIEIKAE